MAAPVAGYIRLADDSAYTGKKLRAQSRVVGANTVYERMVYVDRKTRVLGVYECCLTQQTVSATSHDGTTTGMAWLHMPTAVSGRSARIRRVKIDTQSSTVLATPTAPRLRMDRFTFTGVATGTTVLPDADALRMHPAAQMAIAVSGLTVTLVAALSTAAYCGALSAISANSPRAITSHEHINGGTWGQPTEDEFWVIAPGEGVVFYQDVAGTTSDTRKVDVSLIWDEIDTA